MGIINDLRIEAKECECPPAADRACSQASKVIKTVRARIPRCHEVCLGLDGDVIMYWGSAAMRLSVYCRTNGDLSYYVTRDSFATSSEWDTEYGATIPVDRLVEIIAQINENETPR